MHNLSPADEMCALTVRSEMNIRSAISALVYPSAARTTASRSRSGRASSMARASSRRDCGCCMFRSLMSCRWLDGLNCGRPSHTSVMRRMMSSGASVLETKPSALPRRPAPRSRSDSRTSVSAHAAAAEVRAVFVSPRCRPCWAWLYPSTPHPDDACRPRRPLDRHRCR